MLCPAIVFTRLGESARNRPIRLPKHSAATAASPGANELAQKFWERQMEEGLQPSQVADRAFTAIREEQFYILTHPQNQIIIQRRLEDILQGRNPTNAMRLRIG